MLVGGDDRLVIVANQMIDLLLLDWILDYIGHLALDAIPVHIQALLEQLWALLGVLCECRLREIPASIPKCFQLDSARQCFHICDLHVGKFEHLRADVHPVNIFGLIKYFLKLFASIEWNCFKSDLINFQFSHWQSTLHCDVAGLIFFIEAGVVENFTWRQAPVTDVACILLDHQITFEVIDVDVRFDTDIRANSSTL